MKPSIKKFLEFNGNDLYFTLIDKTWWIALKPICDALKVNWQNQHKKLKEDSTLNALSSEQTMVGPHGKERKMTCLPEKVIYGWLFQIQSQSPELLEYKWECYNILFDHFHGAIMQRSELLNERSALDEAIFEIEERKKQTDEEYNIILNMKKRRKELSTVLNAMDKDLVTGQISLFKYSENN